MEYYYLGWSSSSSTSMGAADIERGSFVNGES
jgi:hypothetical protein